MRISKDEILLYYWNSVPNLGDVLSRYIVEKISPGSIKFKNPFITKAGYCLQYVKFILDRPNNFRQYRDERIRKNEAILFAIGSILDFAPKNSVVWGSGFREPNSRTKAKNIVAVRGLLSRKLLGEEYKDIVVGDPAILISKFYPVNRRVSKGITLIPHFMDYSSIVGINNGRYNVLDIRSVNVEEFVSRLCESKYVLSSSLHGVIIAHAYGVPALWVKKGYVGSSEFKYYDYFSSLGWYDYPDLKALDLINMTEEEIQDVFKIYENRTLPDINVITNIQDNLLKCFPYKLN